MVITNIARAVRTLRLARGGSQATLGARAGVSRELVSRLERDDVAGMTLGNVDRVATALGASLRATFSWRGAKLDRLMDARHAALQHAVSNLLTELGWVVRVEVSFNHFGDRGRVDILAFHPGVRVVLVVEIKSALGDIQETIGRLDVKTRLGRQLARNVGWTGVAAVVPALVILDARPSRKVVSAYPALFARLSVRGRTAVAWLRRPLTPEPDGLLWFANGTDSRQVSVMRGHQASGRRNSRRV